jgi:cytochrome P450
MSFLLVAACVASLIVWPYRTLLYNYNKARKFKLPILITPIQAASFPHSMLGNFGGKTNAFLRSFPFGIFNFLDYTGFEWFWANGRRLHSIYGPAFVVVSPGEVHLVVADPEAGQDILIRRREFVKDEKGTALDVFGKSVFSLNGPDWQRHRRITTTFFNEKISKSVWKESLVQASSMLRTWSSKGKEGVRTMSQDTMTLSLHVLTANGFGKSYDFDAGVQEIPQGHSISYRESLRLIITNIFSTILLARLPIPEWIMPASWLEVKKATAEFMQYMVEILHEERTLTSENQNYNLLSAFLRASEAEKERDGLSDSEIFGNLFIYTIGGHETTANTIAYAILLLAIHPQWQEWIREEIRMVLGLKSDMESWDYEKEYPRLKRCLAIMVGFVDASGDWILKPSSTKHCASMVQHQPYPDGQTTPTQRFYSMARSTSFQIRRLSLLIA